MGNKNQTRFVSWRGRMSRDTQGGIVYPTAVIGDNRGYGYQRTGSNDPKFRVKIANGQNATGSMTVNASVAETTDVNAVLYKRGSSNPNDPEYSRVYRSSVEGVHLSLNLPTPISTHYVSSVSFDKACADALRVFHRKLTGRRRAFMGSVAALELRKTLEMVVRPAKSLRSQIAFATRRLPRIMKSLKRSGASKKSAAKVLADTYLEMTFGWQPLLADTRDGALALARLATKDGLERQQFRAYAKDVTPLAITMGNNYSVGYDAQTVFKYNREWRDITRVECIIYGKFQYRLQDNVYAKSSALRLAELAGFTLADFVPSAWEALPWSFLVDYFTNVGDVLEAFSNNVSDVLWASEVHIHESKEDFISTFDEAVTRTYHGPLLLSATGNSLHSQSSRRTIVRIPTGLDFTTYLRFNLPQGLQWLNIAALATGARPPKPFY